MTEQDNVQDDKAQEWLAIRETCEQAARAGAAKLLLAILRNDMQVILERYVRAQRQQVVAAFEGWWDKYCVTLTNIEDKRSAAETALGHYLRVLGYA